MIARESKDNSMLCDPASNRRHVESGSAGVKWDTGQMNVGNQAASAKWVSGRTKFKLRKKHRIATWNVRGLLEPGKLYILERELIREKVDICGVSETHWAGQGHWESNHYKIFMSGANKTGQKGVAILVQKNLTKYILEYHSINDRLIKMTLDAQPTKIHILQTYMPTCDGADEEIEEMYQLIHENISNIPKKEPIIIMGDWNAKIGETRAEEYLKGTVGKYGMGERNERGERLLQFAIDSELSIMNTMFKHHPRRLSTWTSPGGRYKNQIDYILVSKRWKSSVINVKTKPAADCGSDHKMLQAEYRIKLRNKVNTDRGMKFIPKEPGKFREALTHSNTPQATGDPNETWESTKNWIIDAINTTNPKERSVRQKHWMTDETLNLVEERRKLRTNAPNPTDTEQEIVNVNRRIKSLSRRDKNNHIKEICKQLEQHADRQESRELFDKVKYLTKEFKPQTQIIKDNLGKAVTNPEGIAAIWKQYCEVLFHDDDEEADTEATSEDKEPYILKSEVETAIRKLKTRKSQGEDGITAEALKEMGEMGIDIMFRICNEVWNTGKWPDDWCKLTFIPIYKKGSPTDCNNYRTLALISHASKVLLTIINERLKSILLPQIPQEQCGFVPGRGTREHILNLRQIIEKSREFNMETYICFVDYSKAFDNVRWHKMWRILREMGTPEHLIQLLKQLYINNTANVRVNNTYSDKFKLKAGVRQGCIISPILFNIYSEHIMRIVFDDWQGGITIGGRKISNLRYADDTLILAASSEELEYVMNRLDTVSREYGLRINAQKTKVMIIDRHRDNQPEIRNIAGYEVVSRFNYLGSVVTNSGGCEEEIRRRLTMARSATAKLTKIWKDTDITKNTKLRLVRALVFPIATYAAETWTIKKTDTKRIMSFEMWVYRRMLRIPWTAHRTNTSILTELNITTRLSTIINQSILRYFGHITRRREGMERLVVEGKIEGKRTRGRSPLRWSDQIKSITGYSLSEAAQHAQEREEWTTTINRVT